MMLKDILVYVDDSKDCSGRIEAALQLAQEYEAHLTGLYIIPVYMIPPYAEAQIGPDILEAQRRAAKARAAAAEQAFKKASEQAGLRAEWRCVEGDLVGTLSFHAHYADLLVLGQYNSRDIDSLVAGIGEQVLLSCGRPVLFIPYIGVQQKTLGKRVMLAWKPTREAVRAVNDALPFLQRAKSVEVMSVNPSSGPDSEGDMPAADICLHLARHGVTARAHKILVNDIDIGNLLLSRAADEEIDLIVMGAYGHSRFREMILGGATRHLLEHMTVPVLMSH